MSDIADFVTNVVVSPKTGLIDQQKRKLRSAVFYDRLSDDVALLPRWKFYMSFLSIISLFWLISEVLGGDKTVGAHTWARARGVCVCKNNSFLNIDLINVSVCWYKVITITDSSDWFLSVWTDSSENVVFISTYLHAQTNINRMVNGITYTCIAWYCFVTKGCSIYLACVDSHLVDCECLDTILDFIAYTHLLSSLNASGTVYLEYGKTVIRIIRSEA